MRGLEPPRLRDGRFEMTIETEGCLVLPPELVCTLGLAPGDIVALEPVDETLRIRFYRQILTFPREALAPAIRWSFTVELLRLSLTALDAGGAMIVPPDVLRLRAGDRRVLSVTALPGASWPLLYLS